MIPLEHILGFSAAMFCVGLLGLFLSRNILRLMLAIEVMLNAAGFGFIGCAIALGRFEGYVMFFMILAIAASEVAMGLAIVLYYHRWFDNLDIRSMTTMGK